RGPGRGGRDRPDQGHPHGAAERGLHRRVAAHDRVRRGGEKGEGEGSADARWRWWWHGRHVLRTDKTSKTRSIRTTPRGIPGAFAHGHGSQLPTIPTLHLIACQDCIAS